MKDLYETIASIILKDTVFDDAWVEDDARGTLESRNSEDEVIMSLGATDEDWLRGMAESEMYRLTDLAWHISGGAVGEQSEYEAPEVLGIDEGDIISVVLRSTLTADLLDGVLECIADRLRPFVGRVRDHFDSIALPMETKENNLRAQEAIARRRASAA